MADADLHKLFRKYIPADWQRIETGDIARGVPDLNGCLNGIDVWIENKKTSSWKVHNIEPEQVGWPEKRARHGGRVFLAVRQLGQSRSGEPRDNLWLLNHRGARQLKMGSRLDEIPPEIVLKRGYGGPSHWDWPLIEHVLFRGSLWNST